MGKKTGTRKRSARQHEKIILDTAGRICNRAVLIFPVIIQWLSLSGIGAENQDGEASAPIHA